MEDQVRAILLSERLRAFSALIAGVTHEVNNPLTSIQGLASLLCDEVTDPRAREDVDIIVKEAQRAAAIIKNLRAFAAKGGDESRPCNLDDAVRQVVDIRGYETRARGIEVILQTHGDLPLVDTVYSELLNLVLMLLLRAERAFADARASTGEPGESNRLVLRTRSEAGVVVLELEVTGADFGGDLNHALSAARLAAVDLGGTLTAQTAVQGEVHIYAAFPACD
ncbi:MAG: hypothetical protein M5U22_13720 [Thermoleophilia bacterium]|nr:hypothetical protein [Thermoleophilia bacterium]